VSRTCPDCHNTYDDEVLHCPEDGRGLSDIPAVDDLIGRTVGSYRVEKLLGKGGMGCVYMGVHPGIGSRVAIKFLHPQFSHDEKIVDRFFNEARAVNVIGHDNILKILDLNVTEDHRHYFVMEFLHGRPLQALLKHNVAVPLDVAGPILLQVCDALEAAHKRGIVHRDLKPDNVYLITMKGKKNFVKVVDFGIARVTDDAGISTGKTQTGMVMGTPAYMSPEQGSGASNKIDGRSDIYSLGVMMFQLASGRLPFPGSNFGEVLIGHLQVPPPQPRSLNPQIPEAYEAVILKCLQKKQEDRYASMKELKHAIEACMDQLRISKDLPHADETDTDTQLHPVDVRPPSFPGARTPGRATGPGAKNRISNPNARPGATRPTPRPASGAMARTSQPPTRLTPAPQHQPGRAGLYAGIGVLAAVAAGVGAFVVLRRSEAPPAPAPVRALADISRQDETPVFLSVVSEPLDAEVVATWKDGEKRGAAPLSLEVPRNAKVHFEFRKSGFVDYAMDVIADQPQTVQAVLKAVPRPPVAAERSEQRQQPERKHKRDRTPKVPDGVVDVLGDLK
jgi:eukaryotic-like serine/threonine-protein kinase